jgi:hypothetical protein
MTFVGHWPLTSRSNNCFLNSMYLVCGSWGQWSRSHEGHYGMQHTTLWSCTHIPNIIDLSLKTKMLWPGQENTIDFCFFSAKLVRTITFLSFQIGQLYLVCGCMTIRGLSRTIMTFVWLFKKQLFDLEVKGQVPTKFITVRDTPPYGHTPTYQISLTYLERNNYLILRWVKVTWQSCQTYRHNDKRVFISKTQLWRTDIIEIIWNVI